MVGWLLALHLLAGQQSPTNIALFSGPLGIKGGTSFGSYLVEIDTEAVWVQDQTKVAGGNKSPIRLLFSPGIPTPPKQIEIEYFEIKETGMPLKPSLSIRFIAPEDQSVILLELVWIHTTGSALPMAKARTLGESPKPDLVRIPHSLHLDRLTTYFKLQNPATPPCASALSGVTAADPREAPGSLNFFNSGE